MKALFSQSREDWYRRVGNDEQVFGIREYERLDGPARGSRVFRVATGAGLEYEVLPDNALDLYTATYRGINLSYLTKIGLNQNLYPFENEFTRYFSGGLLYTCGLLSAGPGNREGETWHPLHGRARMLKAAEVSARREADNALRITGVMREAELFGHNLRLERRISSPVGENEIVIDDVILNRSSDPIDYMMLYHLNFGYPFLCEQTRIEVPEDTITTPRTPFAAEGVDQALQMTGPKDGMDEQVYFHDIPEKDGLASLRVVNPWLHIGCEIACDKETLPLMVEWKCMRSGDYALGIEPSNSFINGRTEEQKRGTIRSLKPYEEVSLKVRLRFFDL